MKNHMIKNRNEKDTYGFCRKCQENVELVIEKAGEPGRCINRIKETSANKVQYDANRYSNRTVEPKIHRIYNGYCRKCNAPGDVNNQCPVSVAARITVKKTRAKERKDWKRDNPRVRGMNIECYDTKYAELLKEQDSKCKICQMPGDKFVMDHDHSNGEVRGLLCSPCNIGLGMFKDDKKRLESAILYLDAGQNGKLLRICG